MPLTKVKISQYLIEVCVARPLHYYSFIYEILYKKWLMVVPWKWEVAQVLSGVIHQDFSSEYSIIPRFSEVQILCSCLTPAYVLPLLLWVGLMMDWFKLGSGQVKKIIFKILAHSWSDPTSDHWPLNPYTSRSFQITHLITV